MKNIYLKLPILLISTLIFCAYACKLPKNKYTSPAGYDFNQPDKFTMPSSLLEISGLALHHSKSDTIYSIQDEDGKLFKQKWDVQKQTSTKFAPKGDFEELTILNDKVFILKSNGSVYSFNLTETAKRETDQVKETKNLVPKSEYESLYADEATNKLYLLCKKCEVDKKANQITGYILDYHADSDALSLSGTFKIDLGQVKMINPVFKTSLNPSALTMNPRTKQWFILSSVNKMLLIADANWKIIDAHRLNSSRFNQPEGIVFDKDNNLFISNEGDEITDGNVLKFSYLPVSEK